MSNSKVFQMFELNISSITEGCVKKPPPREKSVFNYTFFTCFLMVTYILGF